MQQRIILFLNAQIRPWDKDFKEYGLTIKEFCDYLEIDPKHVYEDFVQVSKELITKSLFIKKDKDTIITSWLSSARYHANEGYITLKFSPELRDFLLELQGNYTSYEFDSVKSFRSTYSYRIYELLKQYKKVKERTFYVDELKELFQISQSYKNFHDFRKYVIIPAHNELREKSDICFEYEELKKGRRVEKIKFLITENSPVTEQPSSPAQMVIPEFYVDAEGRPDPMPDIIPDFPFMREVLSVQQRGAIWKAACGNVGRIQSRYDAIKYNQNIKDIVGYMITIVQIPDDQFCPAIPMKPERKRPAPINRFCNFEQREIDFDELERLEREQLKEYMEKAPADLNS